LKTLPCINCGELFKKNYHCDDWVISKEFCKSCNRNLNLSLMLTNNISGTEVAEFLFCTFINELNDTEIFDLSEFKDICNDNSKTE
jgi:hypothetical protein